MMLLKSLGGLRGMISKRGNLFINLFLPIIILLSSSQISLYSQTQTTNNKPEENESTATQSESTDSRVFKATKESDEKKSETKKSPKRNKPFLSKDLLKKNRSPLSSETSATGTFIKSFLVLIAFLLIIYFIFKWIQKKKNGITNDHSDPVIDILRSVPLSTNKTIQLVEIGSKIYILGVGDQNISVINTIEEPTEVHNMRQLCQEEVEGADLNSFKNTFAAYFNNWSKKDQTKKKIEPPVNDATDDFFKEQRNRLKALKDKL